MRAKSYSSKSKDGVLEIERLEKQKEAHLSSAYIRSLVQQLASSRTKDSSSSSENGSHEIPSNQNLTGNSCDEFSDHHKQGNSQQHKKQVRTRLHTTRPYQQKLLNMAEARKEIVTALKFHRASMKQSSENQPLESSSHQVPPEHKSRRNPTTCASTSSNPTFSTNDLDNFSYSQGFSSPYSWTVSPIVPPPSFFQENLNFPHPSQTLGLNLNLQDFANLRTSTFHFSVNSPSVYSSSLFPNTCFPDEAPCVVGPILVVDSGGFGLPPEDDYDVDSPFVEEVKFPACLSVNESFLDDHCSDYYVQDPSLSS